MDKKLHVWFCFSLLVIASYWQINTAVEFQLGFSRPNNNSALLMNAIGYNATQFTGDPLACITRLSPCCHTLPARYGHWFFPNGTEIPIEGSGYSFYRYRRDSGSGVLGGALLNRRFSAMSPNGIYRCVIPNNRRVNQTLYIGLYADSNDNGAQLEPINFVITSDSDQFVRFTLTCTSNGGPIGEMQWERDGVLVSGSSIYPDLTDTEMATYTNTLRVMGRQPGVYTCTATDGETLALSQSFTVEAANPPTDVSATLNMTSGPIIITWGPPASGGAEVTRYRIYYNLGCLSLDIVVARTENRYEMGLNGLLPGDIMSVSIRSESVQLPSELVTIRIGTGTTSTDAEQLTTAAETAVTTAGMGTTGIKTTSDVTMNGMGTATTNVNGIGTALETDDSGPVRSSSDDGLVSTAATGPIGIVNDGLQRRTIKDDPLFIAAVIEGIIIVILIVILIVITVLLIHYRNRVHSMLRQTSQKIDPPGSLPHDLQSDCGTRSTEKLFNQIEVTDV